MTDRVTLPDGSTLKLTRDFTEEQANQIAQDYWERNQPQDSQPTPTSYTEPDVVNDPAGFFESLGAGVDTLQGSFGSLLQGIGEKTGNESWEQKGSEIRKRNKEESADVMNRLTKKFSDAPWSYFKQRLGMSLPSAIPPLLGSVLGPVGAGAGATMGARATASLVGSAVTGTPMFTAFNVDRQIEEGNPIQLGKAAGIGAVQAGSEAIFDRVLLKFLPTKLGGLGGDVSRVGEGFKKRAARKIGVASASGASTEAFQQGLERYAADLDLSSPDAYEELLQGGFDGAILGGGLGFITSIPEGVSESTRKKVNESFREEVVSDTTFDEEIDIVPEQDEKNKKVLKDIGFDVDGTFDTPQIRAKAVNKAIDNASKNKSIDTKMELVRQAVAPEVTDADVTSFVRDNVEFIQNRTAPEIAQQITGRPVDGSLDVIGSARNTFTNTIKAQLNYHNSVVDEMNRTMAINEAVSPMIKEQLSRQGQDPFLNQTFDPDNTYLDDDLSGDVSPGRLSVDFSNKIKNRGPGRPKKSETDPYDPYRVDSRKVEYKDPVSDPEEFEGIPLDVVEKTNKVTKNPRSVLQVIEGNARQKSMPLEEFVQTRQDLLDKQQRSLDFDGPTPETLTSNTDTTPQNFDDLNQTYERTSEEVALEDIVEPFENLNFSDRRLGVLTSVMNQEQSKVQPPGRRPRRMSKVEVETDNNIRRVRQLTFMRSVLNETGNAKDLDVASLSDAFRYVVENTSVLNREDMKALRQSVPKMFKFISDVDGIDPNSLFFLDTPSGRLEIQAYSFAKYLQDKRKGRGLGPARSIFSRVEDFMDRTGRETKKKGINSIDDLVQRPTEADPNINNTLDEALYNIRLAEAQQMSGEYKVKHEMDNISTAIDDGRALFTQMDKIIEKDNNRWREDTTKGFDAIRGVKSFFNRYINSLSHLAAKSPIANRLFQIYRQKREQTEALYRRFVPLHSAINRYPEAFRNKLQDTMAFARMTDQKIQIADDERSFTYKKDGNIVRVRNTDAVELLKLYREYYAVPLTEAELYIRKQFSEQFGVPEEAYNLETLRHLDNVAQFEVAQEKALEDSDPERRRILEGKAEDIAKYKDFLVMLDSFKNEEYIPFMRHGEFGIAVKSLDENMKDAFFTIERGKYKGKYDKFQYEEAMRTIQEKYGDSSKYTIYGQDGSVYSAGEAVEPFMLTQNNLTKGLGQNRATILRTLQQLEDSFNPEKVNEIIENYDRRSKLNGFRSRFLDSKKIDGYSRDWSRVNKDFMDQSGNYLGSLGTHNPLMELEKVALPVMEDANLRETLQGYIDYAKGHSSAEDFIRSMNFFSGMGMNLFSGLLQMFSVPTSAVSFTTYLSPNVLANQAGAWNSMRKALGFIEVRDIFTNSLTNTYLTDNQIKRKVSKGVLSQQQADTIKVLRDIGRISDPIVELETGFGGYESRTGSGKLKQKFNSFGKILGRPVSIGENSARLAAAIHITEVLEGNPKAVDKAISILREDSRFRAQQARKPEWNDITHITAFGIDDALAIFGKENRSAFQRGVGSVVFPFVGYPLQMLELMSRQWNQGPNGKRALATFALGLFLISGAKGLPGAEMFRELMEIIMGKVEGREISYEYEIRKALKDLGTNDRVIDFITEGAFRAGFDIDVAQRIGLNIPGTDTLFTALGLAGGKPTDLMGLQGSILTDAAQAFQSFQEGQGIGKMMENIPVSGLQSMVKGVNYFRDGVVTNRGKQLILPEFFKENPQYGVLRFAGVNPGPVADKRNELYWLKVNSTYPFRTTLKKRAVNYLTRAQRANKVGNKDEYEKNIEKYRETLKDYTKYNQKNKIPFDISRFIDGVQEGVIQRLTGKTPIGHLPKQIRGRLLRDVQEAAGTRGDN